MSNVISFTGQLGKDAEQRYLPSGSAMLAFNVANNIGFGDKKETLWFGCAIYGKQAESTLVDYLKKGQSVFIVGELSQGGDQKQFLNVRVNSIDLVGSAKTSERQVMAQDVHAKPMEKNKKFIESDDDFDDDIPY